MKNQEFKGTCLSQNLSEEDEEILVSDYSNSPQDKFFNQVVDTLQESLLDPEFDEIQTAFMKKYCLIFEATEENKIQYTEIFQKYQSKIQKFIQDKLEEKMPGFTIEEFMELSKTRSHLLDEQFLELLQSFIDFQQFKNLCLIYKDFYAHEEGLKDLTVKGNKQTN